MKNRILLIRTGGTIDSEPYDDPKKPPKFVETLKGEESLIMGTVAGLPNHENVDHLTWGAWDENNFVKDSQKFTPEDMKALADIIRHDERQYFVLTHGTDAMVKNAIILKEALCGSDKTIVFVGAMVPLSMHQKHGSDAVGALSFAIDHIADQKPGVHIVGRDTNTKRLGFFNPADVQKDREASLESLAFTLGSR